MTFTDDDLKRLKYHMEKHRNLVIPLTSDGPSVLIASIIARLEAAEKVCRENQKRHMVIDIPGCKLCTALEAWRKAAGK